MIGRVRMVLPHETELRPPANSLEPYPFVMIIGCKLCLPDANGAANKRIARQSHARRAPHQSGAIRRDMAWFYRQYAKELSLEDAGLGSPGARPVRSNSSPFPSRSRCFL